MSALSYPAFRRYFAAAVPLVAALWAQRVTVGWLAWEASGSAAFVGLVAAAGLLPMWVSGPVFGVLVDRADIRRALRWTTGSMAVLLAAAALLESGPGLGRGPLVALSLLTGIVTSAHHPVRMSLAPRLVPAEGVASVVAITALNFNLARLVAPVLTGLALATVGPVAALAAASALHLPMWAASWTLRPRALPGAADRSPVLRGLRDGMAYAARNAAVREALILTAVMAVALRGSLELLPAVAAGVHGRGAEGLGWLTAAAGAGALTAAAAKAVAPGGGTGGAAAARVAILAGMAALGGQAVAPSWVAALVSTAVVGFASTFAGIGLQAAVQAELPDALRGRVMSLWVVVGMGAVAVGAGLIGLAAKLAGLPLALGAAGALGAAALLAVLPWRGARTT